MTELKAVCIKLSDIMNNLDIIEDTAKRMHEENISWIAKFNREKRKEEIEKASQNNKS